MPNNWHLIVWPQHDGELSRFIGWLTLTHSQRWHEYRQSQGSGHLYQVCFKSFPVQGAEHFFVACRYVERSALRANLVEWAEQARLGGRSYQENPGIRVSRCNFFWRGGDYTW